MKDNHGKGWHEIDWLLCKEALREQQNKLVVAYNSGDMQRVYQLQDELINSFSGKAIAVKSVTTNSGKYKSFAQTFWYPWSRQNYLDNSTRKVGSNYKFSRNEKLYI